MGSVSKKRKTPPTKGVTKSSNKKFKSRKTSFMSPHKGPEMKFVDVYQDLDLTYNTTTPTAVGNLNQTAKGTQNYERVGNKMNLIGLEYLATFYASQVTVAQKFGPSSARILIIYDKSPQTASYAPWSEVMLTQSQLGAAFSNSFHDKPNPGEKDRFLILLDEIVSLPWVDMGIGAAGIITSPGTTDLNKFSKKGYIKLKGLTATFTKADAITEGAILMYTQVNNSVMTNVNTSPWGLQFSTRVSYTDE